MGNSCYSSENTNQLKNQKTNQNIVPKANEDKKSNQKSNQKIKTNFQNKKEKNHIITQDSNSKYTNIMLENEQSQWLIIGYNFSFIKKDQPLQIKSDYKNIKLNKENYQFINNYITYYKAIPSIFKQLNRLFQSQCNGNYSVKFRSQNGFKLYTEKNDQITLIMFVEELKKYVQYNLKIFESWQKIQIFVRKNKQEYQKVPLQKVIEFVDQIVNDFINNKKSVEKQSFMNKQDVNSGPNKEELNDEISNLKRKIIELQEQNNQLYKKIKQNQDKKTKSDNRILELQNKVKELTKINQNLNEKDKKNMLIINQLQEQNKKLYEKIEELRKLHDKERQKQKTQKDALNKQIKDLKQQNMKQEINQLKNKEKNNQNDMKNYQRQIKILKQEKQKYQKQLQNQSKNLLSIENQLKSKNQQINVQNQTIKLISLSQTTDKDKKILETKLSKFNELQNSKNKEIIEKDRKIEEQQKLLKQKDQQINQKILIISKKQEELTKSNNQITKLKKQIFDLKNLLKLRDDEIQKLKKQNSELKKLLKEKEDQIIKLQNQIKRRNQQISRLLNLLNKKEDQIIKANNQIKTFKEQISNFRDQLQDKNNQIIKLKRKIQNISSSLMEVKKQIQTFKLQTSRLKDYLLTKNKQENKFEENIIMLEQKIRKMGPSERSFMQYFSGQVLNINEKQYLQWFVQTLQQKSQKQIRRTKFLYRMDLKNNETFHSYYDEHPHVVFLVKLKNGNLIGAYSAAPFSQKSQQSYTESYLFSITNKKEFSPKSKDKVGRNQRSITWDQYFIVFGNYEFRIRTGEAKFYSNFAVNNSFFDNKGQKLQVLLGNGISNKEVEIETYEIFKIQWNQ